jgi:hypothetical protein
MKKKRLMAAASAVISVALVTVGCASEASDQSASHATTTATETAYVKPAKNTKTTASKLTHTSKSDLFTDKPSGMNILEINGIGNKQNVTGGMFKVHTGKAHTAHQPETVETERTRGLDGWHITARQGSHSKATIPKPRQP